MNKFLIKRAFKSLFRNKLFIILMSILVLITSMAYTIFESSSSSFKTSYDQVVSNGALHDLVIKENFQISDKDEVNVNRIYDEKSDTYVDLNAANLDQYKVASGNTYSIVVATENGKDYSKYGSSVLTSLVTFEKPATWDMNAKNKAVADVSSSGKTIIESVIKSKLKDLFVSSLNDIYSNPTNANALNVADFNEMSAISVESGVAAYKVIQYNADTKVNKMNIYDGTSSFIASLTDQQMLDALSAKTDSTYGKPNTLKGYKITAQNSSGEVQSVYDASAYQAIVSPTYANQNNKKAISVEEFKNLTEEYPYQTDNGGLFNFFDALSNKVPKLIDTYKDNIIWVDQMPFLITGIGVTPDFAYPIIDEKHPTIDPVNQALVYVNQRGLQRTTDSFRTNPKENYISVRFHNNVSSSDRDRYKKEFEEFCQTGVSNKINSQVVNAPINKFANGIAMVTKYDDPNDQMTLTQERVAFLGSLQTTINTISYTTTTLLIVFVSIIVAMVFGVLISSNRKSLSTLLALGYSKTQIALSTATIAVLIGALPSAIGYAIGYGAHFAFINSFDSFWTLPTYGYSFSIFSLLFAVILPATALFFLIAIVTYLTLNYPIPDMLKDSIRDNSWIVAKIMSPLKGLGIKTKYAIALTLRNSGKVLLVSLTTVIAATALMVGISTIGRASYAYNNTVALTNYEYKVDLYSPTKEGGQYSRVYYGNGATGNGYFTDANMTTVASSAETYKDLLDDERLLPHWHVPGTFDKNAALPGLPANAYQPTLLSQEAQVAKYLDHMIQTKALINTSVAGVNPWSTASQLMPDNQLNTANNNLEQITKLALANNVDISKPENFIKFINDPTISTIVHPYLITYDTVVTDQEDETYTYIDSDISINNQNINYHITGIKDNSAMYNIDQSTLNAMNIHYYNSPNYIPVLINKYTATNYGLKEGSTLSGVINNDVDRNFNSYSKHDVKYIIEGIIDGYNDAGFITTQKIANQVVGLDKDAFNGVMSTNKNSALLSSLPLYSPSGIYLATDSLNKGSDWEAWLNLILKNPSIWKYQNVTASNFDEFVKKYSNSPLSSMVNKVEWQKMNQTTFVSVSKLTSLLIDVIEGLSIVLSIVFTIIVIALIIKTNRKRIATLWTIGYRKREITRIFASNLIVPLIVAAAIAAPMTIGLLVGLKTFIMHFGHILIPFTLFAWIPFVVMFSIAIVYVLATAISVRSLSSAGALEAFKED